MSTMTHQSYSVMSYYIDENNIKQPCITAKAGEWHGKTMNINKKYLKLEPEVYKAEDIRNGHLLRGSSSGPVPGF